MMGILDWLMGTEEPLRQAAGTYTKPYDRPAAPPRNGLPLITMSDPRMVGPFPSFGERAAQRQAAGTYTKPYDVKPPIPTARPSVPAEAAPAKQGGLGGFLSGFFGPDGRDSRQRLAIALEGMTMHPNQALIQGLQQDIADRKAESTKNKTIAWLRSLGTQNAMLAADALETGSIDAGSAIQYAMQKPEDNRTDDQREYDAAVSAGFQGSFMDYMLAMKKAGASTTTLPAGETAYDKFMGENAAKTYTGIQDAANAASDQLANLTRMETLMNDPNFISGTGTEAIVSMKKLVEAMGGNPADVGSVEAFRGATAQAVLGAMGGSLGAGFSNADRSFVESMAANLDNSVQGNRMIIDAQKRIARRKLEIAQLADQYIQKNGRLDAGFNSVMRDYAEKNPLFGGAPAGQGGGSTGLSTGAQSYITGGGN